MALEAAGAPLIGVSDDDCVAGTRHLACVCGASPGSITAASHDVSRCGLVAATTQRQADIRQAHSTDVRDALEPWDEAIAFPWWPCAGELARLQDRPEERGDSDAFAQRGLAQNPRWRFAAQCRSGAAIASRGGTVASVRGDGTTPPHHDDAQSTPGLEHFWYEVAFVV